MSIHLPLPRSHCHDALAQSGHPSALLWLMCLEGLLGSISTSKATQPTPQAQRCRLGLSTCRKCKASTGDTWLCTTGVPANLHPTEELPEPEPQPLCSPWGPGRLSPGLRSKPGWYRLPPG